MDLIVENDHAAHAPGLPAGRHSDRREKVGRAIGAGEAWVAHGARHNERALVVDQKVERERRLLEGVGALGDHHGVGAIRKGLLDRPGEIHQVVHPEVARRHLPEGTNFDVGQLANLRHRTQKVVTGQADAGSIGGIRGGARDRAAEGEESELRRHSRHAPPLTAMTSTSTRMPRSCEPTVVRAGKGGLK